MKVKIYSGFAAVCIFLMVASCSKKEKQKLYNEVESEKSCLAEPSWFPHSQTTNPKEGKDSPFANGKTVTNLDFYKWSWQKFLWLTKPVQVSRTLNIMDDGKLKPLTILDTLPLFLVEDKIIAIDDAMREIKTRGGANVHLIYNEQACSNQVLQSNPDYGLEKTSYEVLYSLHTSPIMQQAAKDFIYQMETGVLDSVVNYKGFPVGSLELKVSWIDIAALPDGEVANYFVTKAAISRDGGKTFKVRDAAMLGMHVVGVVENHPEFVWATFQKKDMTVAYDFPNNKATASEEKLLFKKGSTSGIEGILFPNNGKTPTPYEAYELFEYGVPVNKDGSFMVTSQSEPNNLNNIKDINTCVSNNLKDVFKNYYCNGAVWLNTEDYKTAEEQGRMIVSLGNHIGSAEPKGKGELGLLRGSTNCANATMETFTQTFQSSLDSVNVSTLANCFSCHTAPSFKNYSIQSPLYVSHIFDAAVQRSNGSSDKEIELMKNKQVLMHFIEHN